MIHINVTDINECIGNACGPNAVCLNTPGSYDCQCQAGHSGNPFMMCMPTGPEVSAVECQAAAGCDSACTGIACGANAACSRGACLCLPGYSGDASAGGSGCALAACRNDLDCPTREICFQANAAASVADGGRRCVDACSRLQCGPNAVCLVDEHRPSCVCQDGFTGNPNDAKTGCQQDAVSDRCARDDQCPGDTVCNADVNGVRQCVDLCAATSCAADEICRVRDATRPVCECQTNFVRHPVKGLCEKPSLPDCVSDSDCSVESTCRPDLLGVRKCSRACADFTCPPNSNCRAANHAGQCVCRDGFTGNPNDRNGCSLAVAKDQCDSDAQCAEAETCAPAAGPSGVRKCSPVCQTVKCGRSAICVANNHVAKCQCPKGLYAGDATSADGCVPVECLTNADCPKTMACAKVSATNKQQQQQLYKCQPVCQPQSCGVNAICLAENHMAMCSCPSGYEGNPHPEIECSPVDLCPQQKCHPTAGCQTLAGQAVCTCPPDSIGDPYGGNGCRTNGTCPLGDADCPPEARCSADGRCVDPCDDSCGPNAACKRQNHRAVCSCPKGFAASGPSPASGCVRLPQSCRSDSDCSSGGGACRAACIRAAAQPGDLKGPSHKAVGRLRAGRVRAPLGRARGRGARAYYPPHGTARRKQVELGSPEPGSLVEPGARGV